MAKARLLAPVAAGLLLLTAALWPFWVDNRHGYGLGMTVAIAIVMALGYQVTYGFSGQLSVAHAPLAGVGAYTVAQLTTQREWSFWAALPPAVALAAAFGAVVGLPGLRVSGDILALVTLGAGEILQSLFLNTQRFTGGYQGIAGVPPVSVFGSPLDDKGLYLVAVGVAAVVLSAVAAMRASPLGRAWLAGRDDEVAAAALGIRTGRLRLLAFAVGAGGAGAGGALYAVQNGFVSSVSFGLNQTVTVILIVLVAGQARLTRTVVAALVATVGFDQLTRYGAISEGATGLLILAVVAVRLGLPGAAWAWLVRLRPQVEPA